MVTLFHDTLKLIWVCLFYFNSILLLWENHRIWNKIKPLRNWPYYCHYFFGIIFIVWYVYLASSVCPLQVANSISCNRSNEWLWHSVSINFGKFEYVSKHLNYLKNGCFVIFKSLVYCRVSSFEHFIWCVLPWTLTGHW